MMLHRTREALILRPSASRTPETAPFSVQISTTSQLYQMSQPKRRALFASAVDRPKERRSVWDAPSVMKESVMSMKRAASILEVSPH